MKKSKIKKIIFIKNKVNYVFLCLLFGISICFGQGSIDNELTTPDIFPSSPEASTLGQFGEIPVNLSRGTTGFSVPIHAITEGEFSLPISLNYYNNGLIRDNIPGCLGLGWSLNAGGMVTRQVRGRPDESPNGYIGQNMIGLNWVVKFYNEQLNGGEINSLNEQSAIGAWDTQPDKFMVSVGSLNATFYFDENKNPVIKPYKPYQINIINDDFEQGIEITDDKGVIYTFQAKEYSERIAPYYGAGDIVSSFGEYISGWKLTQIQTPTNRIIDFTYSDYIYTQEISSQSQSVMLPSTVQGLNTKHRNYQISSKLLTNIQFPLGEIVFNHISQSTTDHNQYLSRLHAIQVKNLNDDIINEYDFTYDNINKTRKLLEDIEINNDPTHNYGFEYFGNPADDIPFYKQDFWGYVNANASVGRLVNPTNMYEPRKPNFNSAITGVLSKITYPTKGSTEFLYEPNTYDPGPDGDDLDDYYAGSGECALLTQNLYVSVNSAFNAPTDTEDIETFTVTSDTYMRLNLNVIKNAPYGDVYAGLRRISGSGSEIGCESTALDPCDECSVAQEYICCGFAQDRIERSFTSSKQLKLLPGVYELYVTAEGPPLTCTGNPNDPFGGCQSLSATASISYSDGTVASIPRSRETGGVRVSKVTSCPDDNPANCITKEYIYETSEGISQGHIFRSRNLFKSNYFVTTTNGGGVETNEFLSYSSSSNLPLGSYSGSHLIYKEVIERNIVEDGNQNNGSKITKYNYVEVLQPQAPFIIKFDREYQNGKVIEERILDNQGDDERVIFTEYDFIEDLNINQRVIGFKAVTTHSVSNGQDAYINDTSVFSNNTNVDRVSRVRDFNWLGTNNLEVDKHYQYTNPQGHIKDQTVEYDNGDILKTSYKYPYEPYQNQVAVANQLRDINRLTSITEKSIFNNDELLHKEHTLYRDWGNSIIKPEFTQIGKANDAPENRIVYHNYDTQGNPTEYIQDNGSPLTILWGYNKQYPIASIANSTYSEVISVAGLNTSVFDNPSSDNALRIELNKIRAALSHAQVTSYTYKPLVGMTSETDPRGYIMYYEYDQQNRLKFVKDQNGKLYRKNEYNYKTND